MLLAIDIGNTDTKFGIQVGNEWAAVWRRPTADQETADDLRAWLTESLTQAQLGHDVDVVSCVSVVPSKDATLKRLGRLLTEDEPFFLRTGEQVGMTVQYDPPTSLGADRLANVLGALEQYGSPVIVVDFGSATTFSVGRDSAFVGGAILPGVVVQADSLSFRTAQLPRAPLSVPEQAIGGSTLESLQSGLFYGHVGAVEKIVSGIQSELGEKGTVLATGGNSHLFIGATAVINHFLPYLTLDGVAAAYRRFSPG